VPTVGQRATGRPPPSRRARADEGARRWSDVIPTSARGTAQADRADSAPGLRKPPPRSGGTGAATAGSDRLGFAGSLHLARRHGLASDPSLPAPRHADGRPIRREARALATLTMHERPAEIKRATRAATRTGRRAGSTDRLADTEHVATPGHHRAASPLSIGLPDGAQVGCCLRPIRALPRWSQGARLARRAVELARWRLERQDTSTATLPGRCG
jgi:hypothetical protein